jgi:hypothetical protein
MQPEAPRAPTYVPLPLFRIKPPAKLRRIHNRTSDLVLLDAAHIDAKPVAVVLLPQRVPQGLHGTWIPNA